MTPVMSPLPRKPASRKLSVANKPASLTNALDLTVRHGAPIVDKINIDALDCSCGIQLDTWLFIININYSGVGKISTL